MTINKDVVGTIFSCNIIKEILNELKFKVKVADSEKYLGVKIVTNTPSNTMSAIVACTSEYMGLQHHKGHS